jgi:2-polyprenyl-3-methyl-5-hydroxy-6-metoxy-1,4-benzoquinol methylase
MRTVECPRCPLCGGAGEVRHDDLEDRLFDAPGRWRLKCCANPGCSVLWLDPQPHPEDLWLAYRNYYTHELSPHSAAGLLQHKDHRAYAARHLGYPSTDPAAWRRLIRIGFKPREQERALFFRMYLPFKPGGRVLDVGCGAGNELLLLNALGWKAEGLDPDPSAVAAAGRSGLTVAQGDLLQVRYAEASFDAVTMSHVVEHLAEPQLHFRKCWRILRPGGRLVVVTPNADSLGHRKFGRDWRGLEPPRHLQIFTLRALVSLARGAGFETEQARTSARDAGYLWLFSERLKAGLRGRNAATVAPGVQPPRRLRRLEYVEGLLAALGIPFGEELVLVARKPDRPEPQEIGASVSATGVR